MKFENIFWTSDYITGIQTLIHTLEESRDEGTDQLDYFKSYVDLLEIQSQKLKEINKNRNKRFVKHQEIKSDIKSSKIIQKFEETHQSLGSLKQLKRVQLENSETASELKTNTSLKIQSDVILRLEEFLEDFNDFISDSKKTLNNQYFTYTKSTQQAKNTDRQFISKCRELEDSDEKENKDLPSLPEKKESSQEPVLSKSNTDTSVTESGSNDKSEESEEDEVFDFPLTIGNSSFGNIEELKNFMLKLTQQIPLKRRMFPIPGINNEYFSSESFSKWLRSNKENEDSRRKIEKFGQDLINLGLISNWNKLSANKFISDEGYFEFTDLAKYIANFDTQKSIPEVQITPSTSHDSTETVAITNTSTSTTTFSKVPKRNVFDGLKKRLGQSLDADTLRQHVEDAKQKHIETIRKNEEDKTILENSIQEISHKAEIYETNRIKLIYFVTKEFNELIHNESQKQFQSLQTINNDFVYNDDTLKYEVLQKSINPSASWYWPKHEIQFIDHSISKSHNIIQIFGNDLVNQHVDITDEDHKTKSASIFIKNIIKHLDNIDDIETYWANELDIKIANEVKRFIENSIPQLEEQYSEDSKQDIYSFVIIKIVDDLFKKFPTSSILNALKLWLLELPDSVIPFTSYDSLKSAYNGNTDQDSKLKILGAIPRQNLATLLVILKHLSTKIKTPDQIIQNERVPLYHLLIRPSPKYVSANFDDLIEFEPLIKDLLNPEFQEKLYGKLNDLEISHIEREKRVEESIKSLKNSSVKPRQVSSPLPKSNSNNSLSVDENGLRPFKTRSPNPSPAGSPKTNRSRTNSRTSNTNILLPSVKRPSENLHKRTLSKNLEKDEANLKIEKARQLEKKEGQDKKEKENEEKIVINVDSD
ncbi:Rho-GTPase-activating protein 8 [Wickerhamomyces ciferrii]|uniref:Rho-GTPase-activating protein 8 n=1 Tax=Wickerhamomyces ciferrii (strain ATCC 14091 / BCRC 22168 / CBS 111 / JCM 3599 / NBRC 0793 / NRRL Y-1031 F-60-10) TaxID=1206466 RepID=K0KHM5_WICCF|nr:Rho-GTPase-activating protein 8 [Wickerhamomyces ciferrii]CCH40869.1 Rho-GTPase-activating protein 8 [Wickerhamomyces ciferrii]